jgi:hypothetical protein
MRRGLCAVVGVAALLSLTACAVPTPAERAHADAVAQAETSRRHLEALVPFDLAPMSTDLARRALVPGGVLLSSTGTNVEATVEAKFTGVGWSESIEPTRTDLPFCFRMTRHGGTHDFQVTELDACP